MEIGKSILEKMEKLSLKFSIVKEGPSHVFPSIIDESGGTFNFP